MYNRGNTGRELFSRHQDYSSSSSDRWCQQGEGSQDWSSQLYGSQDSQRLSAPTYRTQPPMANIEGSNPGSSGRGAAAPSAVGGPLAPPLTHPPDHRDLTLARDIRFGLYTILTVMRKLPEQLKDACSEISRTSNEPEVTRSLIKDTSSQLQHLVSGIQDKLSQLLNNKDNEQELQQSLFMREEDMSQLVSRVQEAVNQRYSASMETHITTTKKDFQRHMKKMKDSLQEITRVEPAVKNLEEGISKVAETITTSLVDLKTSFTCLEPRDPPGLENIATSTQRGFDQIQSSIQDLSHKVITLTKDFTAQITQVQLSMQDLSQNMTSLPKDYTAQITQVMREVIQKSAAESLVRNNSSTSSSITSLVSPTHRVFSNHRPIFPLAENGYRCQVSPVAHVPPITQASPQVSMAPPVSHPNTHSTPQSSLGVSPCPDFGVTPVSRPSVLQHPHSRQTPQPRPDAPSRPNSGPTHVRCIIPPQPRPGMPPPQSRPGMPPPHSRPGILPPQTKQGILPPQTKPGILPPQPNPFIPPPLHPDYIATPHSRPGILLHPNCRETPQARPHIAHRLDPQATPQPRSVTSSTDFRLAAQESTATKDLGKAALPNENTKGTPKCSAKVVFHEEDRSDAVEEESQKVACRSSWLLEGETQRFTPQKGHFLVQFSSDSSDQGFVLDCDSSSSSCGSSLKVATRATPTLSIKDTNTSTDDWVEGIRGHGKRLKTKKKVNESEGHAASSSSFMQKAAVATLETVTPNVRKTSPMVLGGNITRSYKLRGSEVGTAAAPTGTISGCRNDVGIKIDREPYSHTSVFPNDPVSGKKRKVDDSLLQENYSVRVQQTEPGRKYKVNFECAPKQTPRNTSAIVASRARRYLTPQNERGIKLRFFKTAKKKKNL
nr:uncharacterized protein LOC128697866 isoform X2 [Cherax quadricarinatus]